MPVRTSACALILSWWLFPLKQTEVLTKVKLACELPKMRGKKKGKEESGIIKEEALCRGERKLVLGDKNLKKIKDQLVSKKRNLDRERRTDEDSYARKHQDTAFA